MFRRSTSERYVRPAGALRLSLGEGRKHHWRTLTLSAEPTEN